MHSQIRITFTVSPPHPYCHLLLLPLLSFPSHSPAPPGGDYSTATSNRSTLRLHFRVSSYSTCPFFREQQQQDGVFKLSSMTSKGLKQKAVFMCSKQPWSSQALDLRTRPCTSERRQQSATLSALPERSEELSPDNGRNGSGKPPWMRASELLNLWALPSPSASSQVS